MIGSTIVVVDSNTQILRDVVAELKALVDGTGIERPPSNPSGRCRDCKSYFRQRSDGLSYCFTAAKSTFSPSHVLSLDGIEVGPDFGCIHWEARE